jgi:hypothetical protein
VTVMQADNKVLAKPKDQVRKNAKDVEVRAVAKLLTVIHRL